MRSLARIMAVGFVAALAIGCASETEDEAGDGAGAQSVTQFRTIWKDVRELDGSGWTKLIGEATSTEIQKAISGDFLKAEWDVKAASTGANVDASSLPGMSVYDLDTISSGLLQRFGDADLPARVNAIRKARVQGGYYLDATTTAGITPSKSWSITGPSAGDFTSSISFGFDAGAAVTSRVVVHSKKDELKNEAKAWLSSLVSSKDYFFAEGAEKVDAMQPGEMWGMRGKGRLGAHVGLSVPVIVKEIIASAAFSAHLEGIIDVQVVKLDDNQVVVDLGINDGRLGAWSAGIGTSFGIPDMCKDSATGQNGACLPTIGSGAASVDLKTKVPELAQKVLNEYLGVRVTTGGSNKSSRLSVLRMKFDFGAASGDAAKEARAAFARAIRFDARHAQTLANQQMGAGRPSVIVEADLFRAMATSTRYTDFNAFGFSVYQSNDTSTEGSMTLKTPTDTKVITYALRNKRGGWFQTRHGFDRLAFASTSAKEGTHANLVLNLATSDAHLDERGLVTENADAALLSIAGRPATDALDAFGNVLEGKVASCGTNDACVFGALGGADAESARTAFEAAREHQIGSLVALRGLPGGYKELASEAVRMRLSAQALAFSGDQFEGPSVDFTFGIRLDDKGLDELLDPKREADFKARAYDYLVLATSMRRADVAPAGRMSKEDLLERIRGENVPALDDPKWPVYKPLVDALAKSFVESAKKYQAVRALDRDARNAMSQYEGRYAPVFVGLDIDALQAVSDRKAAQQDFASLHHQAAQISAGLVDGLYDIADGEMHRTTHLWAEHLVGYTLAAMVSPTNRETTIDLRVAGRCKSKQDLKPGEPECTVRGARFNAAGLGRWVKLEPVTAGEVPKVSFGALDLVPAAKAD